MADEFELLQAVDELAGKVASNGGETIYLRKKDYDLLSYTHNDFVDLGEDGNLYLPSHGILVLSMGY